MHTFEVSHVTVTYRETVGIRDASLIADAGEIFGFIGADGAGKSSLMHTVAGVIPFSGSVTFRGRTYRSPREAEPLKDRIGLMPQGIGLVL